MSEAPILTIVGANGMLGTDLAAVARAAGLSPVSLDLPDIDITQPASVDGALSTDPSVVVNCAAYTRVDDAEAARETAFRVNADGAGILATACAARGSRLIHLSTDYVFDGAGTRPYRESDPVAPLSVYGESKLEGERQVQSAGTDHLIVRTQSLFGRHGHNFVKTITGRLAAGAGELRVVDDQVCSPTYTRHLATAILALIESGRTGVVHVRAMGACSWHGFATAIANRIDPVAVVHPVPTSAFPTPARRPAYSVLDCSRFEAWTGTQMPEWQRGLDEYLSEAA